MGGITANAWMAMESNPGRVAAEALLMQARQYLSRFADVSRELVSRRRAPVFAETLADYEEMEALEMEQTMFCYGASVLALRLMRADSEVNSKERQSFLALFTLAGMGKGKLSSLLAAAAKDQAPSLQYARQINTLLEEDEELRQEFMLRLARLAIADAPLERAEFNILCETGRVLGFSRMRVALMALEADGPLSGSPHEVLRLEACADEAEIHAAYRERMRHTHPDRWQGAEGCEELHRLATLKAAAVNEAYRKLLPVSAKRRMNNKKAAFLL